MPTGDIVPVSDGSVADWITERLYPFDTFSAGSVIPSGFAAYARILHPVQAAGGHEVRWSEIAAGTGRIYHPDMQFESIATPAPGSDFAGGGVPSDEIADAGADSNVAWRNVLPHALPPNQVASLVALLRRFTSTPERTFFCVWEGYGGLPEEVLAPDRQRVRRPHRNYLPFRGSLQDVPYFQIGRFHREVPDYWWPEDRAWCVATDVDLFWTYVGASQDCIDALLANDVLETVPATLEQGLGIDSDPLNPLTPDEMSRWRR